MTEKVLFETAELFKVFGDSTRIRILYSLYENEKNVNSIACELNMTTSAVSHQLKILKQNKLVTNRKDGKTVYYNLADDHIKTIINQGIKHAVE